MSKSGFVLEVIACTVADALEAEKGGAHRLEVISHFECGGLTPSLELVREIQTAVSLPLRIMVRENDGYHVASNDEVERICQTVRELAAMRVDGVVLGFIRDRKVDIEVMLQILKSGPALKATFHRAFDEASDPFQALAEISQCGQIDRVLTSGGQGNWTERSEKLSLYQREAGEHLKILVGGGVDASAIKTIRNKTNLVEFHIGRAARVPATVHGSVQSARVKDILCELDSAPPLPL
jgi:copper homeostasis protein